jgi:DNA-binding NarL/FixJ family response regulator
MSAAATDARPCSPVHAVPRLAGEARALLAALETQRSLVVADEIDETRCVVLVRARDPAELLCEERLGDRRAPVVAVCDEVRHAPLWSALARGLRGVVLSHAAERTLPLTLAAVLEGMVCFAEPRQVARPLLSIREKQVIGLVALGLANAEIAERLFVAESTVKSHLTSVFAKLGVRSRHEAIDLILNPAAGLGLGILALAADPVSAELP